MSKEFWNKRYQADEFIYGTEPNVYFKKAIDSLKPGKILLPAEGEGRNAVYAARRGWVVDCFDLSKVAKQKALELAREYQVTISYDVADIHNYTWPNEIYDAVGLIYVHDSRDIRQLMHYRSVESLKPGGTLIFEAFHKDQLNYDSGGPRNEENLYDLEELEKDFKGLSIKELDRYEVTLSEGRYHRGEAAVVRLVAQKL